MNTEQESSQLFAKLKGKERKKEFERSKSENSEDVRG